MERGGTDLGGKTLLFAFHLLRALTSAWIRQRVCSHRSVLLFGGGDERSCTSCTVKVSKYLQIMIFRCNFTCVLEPAVSVNGRGPKVRGARMEQAVWASFGAQVFAVICANIHLCGRTCEWIAYKHMLLQGTCQFKTKCRFCLFSVVTFPLR